MIIEILQIIGYIFLGMLIAFKISDHTYKKSVELYKEAIAVSKSKATLKDKLLFTIDFMESVENMEHLKGTIRILQNGAIDIDVENLEKELKKSING